jgi:hypothetical protein
MDGMESKFYQELKAWSDNPCVPRNTTCSFPLVAADTLKLQGADPFFIMAGPNVIQSEEHIFKMCRQIKHITDR